MMQAVMLYPTGNSCYKYLTMNNVEYIRTIGCE